jgi:cell division protein ZapA (FtsZ GTPase activity inhibitor)
VQKQITILGRNYALRADNGEELEAAALDVDSRMKSLMTRSPAVDPYTVAMLTALNLASELRAAQRGYRARLEAMERETAAIEAVLSAAVGEGDT